MADQEGPKPKVLLQEQGITPHVVQFSVRAWLARTSAMCDVNRDRGWPVPPLTGPGMANPPLPPGPFHAHAERDGGNTLRRRGQVGAARPVRTAAGSRSSAS